MTRPRQPELGLHTSIQIPGPVQRRTRGRPIHEVRVCHDNRAYVAVPFTIPTTLTVGKQSPEWRVDRDYWLARIMAEVGRHDASTHPNDGTPGGAAIRINVHRLNSDNTGDLKILASDSRLRIDIDHHEDAMNNSQDGETVQNDFVIQRLSIGQKVYVDVLSIGTTRPGTNLVVTLTLVPIP